MLYVLILPGHLYLLICFLTIVHDILDWLTNQPGGDFWKFALNPEGTFYIGRWWIIFVPILIMCALGALKGDTKPNYDITKGGIAACTHCGAPVASNKSCCPRCNNPYKE